MNELPLIIIGAGDHARVLLDLLLEQKCNVLGITDSNPDLKGSSVYGIKVLGLDEEILKYAPSEILLVNGIGSVASTKIRAKVFNGFKFKGYSFATIVHPSAIVSSRAKLCEGTQILAGTVINTETVIGADSIINTNASVDHGCAIGSHVHIAPGCTLSGCVSVGDGTHIGTGSSVIQGINIGSNVLIGAGSVVVRSIPDNTKAFGVPAKVSK